MSYLVPFCSCVFSPFSIEITSLGEERANLSAFRTFDRFVLDWICRFPLPLDVWRGCGLWLWHSLDFSLTFFFSRVFFFKFENIKAITRCQIRQIGGIIVLFHTRFSLHCAIAFLHYLTSAMVIFLNHRYEIWGPNRLLACAYLLRKSYPVSTRPNRFLLEKMLAQTPYTSISSLYTCTFFPAFPIKNRS